jgi:hypothetical protein
LALRDLLIAFPLIAACKNDAPADGSSTTGDPAPIPCDADNPCPDPETMVCLVGQCHEGIAPNLEIVSPAQEESVAWTQGGETSDVAVTIRVDGFQIVPPEIDPTNVRAAGHVILELDGVEVAMITEGDAAEGVTVTVPAAATAGGHRLGAHLRLSDGTPYDNPEASRRRFFWFANGEPQIAFVTPWPGDTLTLGQQQVASTFAVLGFELQPASDMQVPGATGIVHAFIDQSFPACGVDEDCAADYSDVLAPENPGMRVTGDILVPADDGDGKTRLTGHLAHTDHEPYCGDDAAMCTAYFDSITLTRSAMLPPEEETTGGAGDTTGGAETGATSG